MVYLSVQSLKLVLFSATASRSFKLFFCYCYLLATFLSVKLNWFHGTNQGSIPNTGPFCASNIPNIETPPLSPFHAILWQNFRRRTHQKCKCQTWFEATHCYCNCYDQCDQMASLFFNIWPFTWQWKLAQWHTKFAKVGATISQIVNKPSKNCPRL